MMNEFEAAAAIGHAVRTMHQCAGTPESLAPGLRPYMVDGVCAGIIQERIDAAIRANHEAMRQAGNRNADLLKLRHFIASTGETSKPTDNLLPKVVETVPGGITSPGRAADEGQPEPSEIEADDEPRMRPLQQLKNEIEQSPFVEGDS